MDALVVDRVTKTYRLGVGRARVREMLPTPVGRVLARTFPGWWARDTFNALDDVSLRVPAGSSVGIVGHNGAGKTTLLKIIARVTAPTKGAAETRGRVGALIDLLVGFNPDLTGRENAYLLASMHGSTTRDVGSRIERILEFAELTEEQAGTPLKRFSAGMIARLGFAVVTALDADLILVDEVLAVGDASFQQKCVKWLDEYRSGGGTLLFVSHNLALVRSMTERAVWLDHGHLRVEGPTSDVLAEYARSFEQRETATPAHRRGMTQKVVRARGLDRWGAGGVRAERVHIQEPSNGSKAVGIRIEYQSDGPGQAIFSVGILDESGREIGGVQSRPVMLRTGAGEVECALRSDSLRPGIYFPIVSIASVEGVVRDRWHLERAIVLDGVTAQSALELGPVKFPARWRHEAR
jgi:ABC-type polysaccharide/polyol phosphate transport system ATPase subunit